MAYSHQPYMQQQSQQQQQQQFGYIDMNQILPTANGMQQPGTQFQQSSQVPQMISSVQQMPQTTQVQQIQQIPQPVKSHQMGQQAVQPQMPQPAQAQQLMHTMPNQPMPQVPHQTLSSPQGWINHSPVAAQQNLHSVPQVNMVNTMQHLQPQSPPQPHQSMYQQQPIHQQQQQPQQQQQQQPPPQQHHLPPQPTQSGSAMVPSNGRSEPTAPRTHSQPQMNSEPNHQSSGPQADSMVVARQVNTAARTFQGGAPSGPSSGSSSGPANGPPPSAAPSIISSLSINSSSPNKTIIGLSSDIVGSRLGASGLPINPSHPIEPKEVLPSGIPDSSSFEPVTKPANMVAPSSNASSSKAADATRTAKSNKAMNEIRSLLAPEVLRRNRPFELFKHLRPVKDDKVTPFTPTPDELAEILSCLDKRTSATYLQLMADSEANVRLISSWVLQFNKDPVVWEKMAQPLLRMLCRTDMAVDLMSELRLGRRVVNMPEKAASARLKSAAEIARLVERYRKYSNEVLFKKNKRYYASSDSEADEAVAKKRKLSPGGKTSISTTGASANGANSANSTTTKAKPTTSKPGGAKTDMSFFSAPTPSVKPKPKAPLPSFKRIDTTSTPSAPASGGAGSLLSQTLSKLQKPSPITPTTPSDVKTAGRPTTIPPRQTGPKLNKKGHTVRWVDEKPDPIKKREFVAVRFFKQQPHELERAPWQLDDEVHGMSSHELDMQEGRAMHHHVTGIEEAIDWYTPSEYYVHDALPPLATPEMASQVERERAIVPVSYASDGVPVTPDETKARIVRDSVTTVKRDASVYDYQSNGAVGVGKQSVTALLANLGSLLPAAQQQPAPPQPQQHLYGYQQQGPSQGQAQGGWGQKANQGWGKNQATGSSNQGWGRGNGAGAGNGPQSSYGAGSGGGPHKGGYGQAAADRWNDNLGKGVKDNSHNYSRRGRSGGSYAGRPFRQTCRYWLQGDCHQGRNCLYLHEHPPQHPAQHQTMP